jgi:hypothetical protein
MIHIRIDDEEMNASARFACGLGWPLPTGDMYFFAAEGHRLGAYFCLHPEQEPCPGCFPEGRPSFGTPISQLSGRPGSPGYEKFKQIAASWGYD